MRCWATFSTARLADSGRLANKEWCDEIIQNLILIKQDFAKNYSGNAHIQEVVPVSRSDKFPLAENHLQSIHKFAEKNPIYFNSYEEKILDVDCTVYEGDINDYWLNSIKHGTSCQPFYPTWMISAYLMTLNAKKFPQNAMRPSPEPISTSSS